ncbi:hypothetical protein VUL84_21545 [Sphingobacterium paramultivorum]|nr:hypothetical protein [Sphingobacterium paramultivorum]WSO13915.1 hypothetical protein VUL84_21545 [Sphingobacterium paramultivorum]
MRKISMLSFIAVSVFHNYCTGQTVRTKDSMAEKMLQYQLSNGAWPKQLVDKSLEIGTIQSNTTLRRFQRSVEMAMPGLATGRKS